MEKEVVVESPSREGLDRLVDTLPADAHGELWAAVRAELRGKLGEERFERWIAPLKVLSRSGEEIRLGVPNRFVQDWIEKRYLAAVDSAIVSVVGERPCGEPRVTLVIDAVLFRERRKEQADVLHPQGPDGSPPQNAPPGGTTDGEPRGEQPRGEQVERPSPEARAAGGLNVWVSGSSPQGSLEQTLEDFIVGASNQLAFKAVEQVLEAPGALYNPLFLYGPSGVGKTHLLKGLYRALRSRKRADRADWRSAQAEPGAPCERPSADGFLRVTYLTGEQYFHHYASSVQDGTARRFRERYRALDVLILDDVHLLVNKRKTQLEFLHTFSSLTDSGRQIILASDVPPKGIKELEAGLVGRFSSGLVVALKKPDFATRLGIVRMRARRLSTRLDDAVLQFVAEHVRTSARELIGALMQLEIHGQAKGGELGLEEARDMLIDFLHEAEKRIDLKKIQAVVAKHFGVSPESLVSASRQRSIAIARQMAMYLGRRRTSKSLSEIGKFFGNRNHTTVKSAETKIKRLVERPDHALARDLNCILESLEE